jgi:hypothetical protein
MNTRVVVLLGCALAAAAVETHYWSQDTQVEFEKGSRTGVALRSDGQLSLAPLVKELADASTPYLWSIAIGANGTAYVAGGPSSNKAAIFELTRAGAWKKFSEIEGMNVFAMAVGRDGRLYAASSPDGKVYKIAANGAAEVFYDPQAKYIWALQFLEGGDLLVATGDKGELHRVTPAGAGKVWLKLDEDHVRSLAVDVKGQVFVGTEPGGLIVRVDASGAPFVVHQSGKREVTTLFAAPDGAMYAAVIGNKMTGTQIMIPTAPVPAVPLPPAAGAPGAPAAAAANTQRIPVAPAPPVAPNPVPGGSEVIRIDVDGSPMKVWSHATDLVYAMALDAKGKLLLGTGNKGSIYRVESPSVYTLLRDLTSTQVTALVRDGSRTLVVTGNVGKVHQLGDALDPRGTFESQVFDVSNFAHWGRLHAKHVGGGGTVAFETRSGNLDRPTQMWSAWAPLKDGRVASPPARFLQWRAILQQGAATGGDGPVLSQVDVAYLPKNLAPRVDIVEPTPANYRFPAPPTSITSIAPTMTLPPIGKPGASPANPVIDTTTSPALTYARGMIGVRWQAADDNGDTLEYTVEIKGENEQTWKLLKDKVRERYLSYDATAFADGRYQIRVTATDQPDNPAGLGLSASQISPYFLIDNTAPEVRNLAGAATGGKLNVRFAVADTLSVVTKAEVSINGGTWTLVEPAARLADSKDLEFALTLDRATAGETTIAVRVTDEFDNQAVAKTVVR